MAEQNAERPKLSQKMVLEDRNKFSLELVENVENFTEEEIVLKTAYGGLLISGKNLKLEDLSIDNGNVFLTGRIDKIEFFEIKEKRSFFKDLFR